MHAVNQNLFYETLSKGKQKDNCAPNPTAAIEVWSNIWSKEENPNENATSLDDVDEDYRTIEAHKDVQVTLEDIQFGVMNVGNWTAAGTAHVQGSGFKRMIHLHPRSKYSSKKESNLITCLTS